METIYEPAFIRNCARVTMAQLSDGDLISPDGENVGAFSRDSGDGNSIHYSFNSNSINYNGGGRPVIPGYKYSCLYGRNDTSHFYLIKKKGGKAVPASPVKPIKWVDIKFTKLGFIFLDSDDWNNGGNSILVKVNNNRTYTNKFVFTGGAFVHDFPAKTIPGTYGTRGELKLLNQWKYDSLADCGYADFTGISSACDPRIATPRLKEVISDELMNMAMLLWFNKLESVLSFKSYIMFTGHPEAYIGSGGRKFDDKDTGVKLSYIAKICTDIAKGDNNWRPVNHPRYSDTVDGDTITTGRSSRNHHIGIITHHGLWKYYQSPEFKELNLKIAK